MSNIFYSELKWKIIFHRCGALSVGDQILSIDETVIENTAYTPEDVMSFLNGPSDRGFTQLQILPVHAIQRKGNWLFYSLAFYGERVMILCVYACSVHKTRIS